VSDVATHNRISQGRIFRQPRRDGENYGFYKIDAESTSYKQLLGQCRQNTLKSHQKNISYDDDGCLITMWLAESWHRITEMLKELVKEMLQPPHVRYVVMVSVRRGHRSDKGRRQHITSGDPRAIVKKRIPLHGNPNSRVRVISLGLV